MDPLGFEPGTTYAAFDVGHPELRLLPRQRRTVDQSFEDEITQWQAEWAVFGPAELQRLSLSSAEGARLTFSFPVTPDVEGWGQAYVVRFGDRTFRFDFATQLDRADVDGPLFDRLVLRPICQLKNTCPERMHLRESRGHSAH